jgi:hypothetical protein
MAALVVETGAGLANANSWVDMGAMDDYCANMGYTTWPGVASPDDRRITAVIRGCAYIVRTYEGQWPGSKKEGRSQALPWPRIDSVDNNGAEIGESEIPIEVKNAQMEAALREYTNPGSLSPDVVGTERILREKVGDLEVQYADDDSSGAAIPVVTVIDGILASLIGPRRKGGVSTFLRG